jgi:hypothetical protein
MLLGHAMSVPFKSSPIVIIQLANEPKNRGWGERYFDILNCGF